MASYFSSFHPAARSRLGKGLEVLRPEEVGVAEPSGVHHQRPLPVRVLAVALSVLLFLTSSPPLFAITMGQIKAGVAGSSGGGQGSSPSLQNAGSASAALTAALTKKSQQQAANVVTAMQKLQQQAAKSASGNLPVGSTVPNGLQVGGLEPFVGKNTDGSLKSGFEANGKPITTTWNGAAIAPSSVPANAANPNYVNIKQNSQNAYLYWNSFNVGAKSTVNFDQSKGGQNSGNWIAFNKVMSASDPSRIFGNISAQGQVYILNQNGILFHNGSTVNTRGLVASTLPINENLAGDALNKIAGRGIANNPDAQFLFTSLAVPSGRNDKNGFDPSKTIYGAKASPGDVVVEKGASIVSPVNSAGVGGLVALVGPNVRNEGFINTPGGQTILASGLQVALLPHPSSDPSLRGMDVMVGKVGDPAVTPLNSPLNGTAGSVINNGLVSAPEGNITLAGKAITLGSLPADPSAPLNGGQKIGSVLDSATSVSLNGRIDLLASYGATKNALFGQQGPAYLQGSTGLINLDSGSVLRILPDSSSSATVVGSSLALNSIVNLLGQSIYFGQGAVLEAPGAVKTAGALSQNGDALSYGVTLAAGQWFSSDPSSASRLLPAEGQIYLESGSVIDVSGSTGVEVNSSQNYLTLQLRGPELADSPLQRIGPIRAKDITVDGRIAGTPDGQILNFPTVADAYAAYLKGDVAWIGTPLGNAAGYAGLIQRGVGQLTQTGGSVSLSAGDAVVMQPGALVNVSGGWSRYSGGNFAATKLITTDGRIVDIAKATPDQTYSGIWKETPQLAEDSYVNGSSGGSLSIAVPAMALQGDLYGVNVTGARQLRSSPTGSMLPGLSSLNLSFQGTALLKNLAGNFDPVTVSSPVPPTVTFSDAVTAAAPAPSFSIDPETGLPMPLMGSVSPDVTLPTSLISSRGFGKLGITDHDGKVAIPAGVVLDFPSLGSLEVNASLIDVSGSVIAPGGSVSLTADRVPTTLANGLSLIPDGVLNQPLLDVFFSKVDGAGLKEGEKVYQYGSLPGNGTINVIDPYNQSGSPDASWNVPLDQLEPLKTGLVSVAKGSVISTAGLVVDDYSALSENAFGLPSTVGGGKINISAYTVSLAGGSQLDVSG
ncbi:MAG: filamentous hemagglutinin N-terminal domain-containing protein, partial [bacterium]